MLSDDDDDDDDGDQRGYWRQRADERLGDPSPPKVDPGAFNGQRQG